MSRHEHFTQMLARRAELSPQEELDLQQHLRDCPACRQTADVYARQAALLRALPLAEPPPALRAKVLSSIQQPPRHVKNTRLLPGRPFLLLAPLAAALLIVAGAFALLNRPHHTNNSAIAPTAPQVRLTAPIPTTTPTPQRSIAAKPSLTPASVRKKKVHPPPSPSPSARQVAPVPTAVPGVNAPILSQALPTPTGRALPASPRPARQSSARTPVRVTAPRPTPVSTPQPTSTAAVPAPLPPGVHPIALSGTLPPGRILPPTPEPPTVPAAPVRGAPTTATPAPASPPPPPPSPVAAPVAPVTTPTPIP
jgi:hypothetical protein